MIIPIEINEDLDKLNKTSGYFNDICYPSTSDVNTDITLKDRKEYFIRNNKTVCQDGCDFEYYDNTKKKVKCSCYPKELSLTSALMFIIKYSLLKMELFTIFYFI